MTTIDSVRPVTAEEQQRAIQTLVLAFSADPFMRWILPGPAAYLDSFADMAVALGGRAFEHGTAYCAGDFAATALWLPSGVQPDDPELEKLIAERVPASRQETLIGIIGQLEQYHPPEPHWYLPLIGVDPTQQGRGFGSTLLERALEACDAARQPAYLESSNARNIPLYERHGFEVAGEIQIGDAPPVWPMLRSAR
jgi:ribosomal protein S18 acetylase RimI-like enzyme